MKIYLGNKHPVTLSFSSHEDFYFDLFLYLLWSFQVSVSTGQFLAGKEQLNSHWNTWVNGKMTKNVPRVEKHRCFFRELLILHPWRWHPAGWFPRCYVGDRCCWEYYGRAKRRWETFFHDRKRWHWIIEGDEATGAGGRQWLIVIGWRKAISESKLTSIVSYNSCWKKAARAHNSITFSLLSMKQLQPGLEKNIILMFVLNSIEH